MKLSVCMDAVFRGCDFYAGMEQLSGAGVSHFEFWRWWDKDVERIAAEKRRLRMDVTALCTKFVSLVDASQRDTYLQGLRETVDVAERLECRAVITQVGAEMAHVARGDQRRSLVDGLRACVPILRAAGVTLLVEPLNTAVDHPGYYLSGSDEAFAIIDEVGDPHVKLLFDIYHQQITEGNLIARITRNIDKIGHFHAAGNPGRHELDSGEIHYPAVFRAIEASGYDGFVGLEYFPLGEPLDGVKRAFAM
jgi:hydroxypyruvate isomerase